MKTLSSLLALSALAMPGCVVYKGGPPHPQANRPPYLTWADGGCYFDPAFDDDLGYFEATVDDANGPLDVVAVYADVYDGRSGEWIETFELFPTEDPYYWFSDWIGQTTRLDCYYGGYEVDIVAYDSYEEHDVLTLLPQTYSQE